LQLDINFRDFENYQNAHYLVSKWVVICSILYNVITRFMKKDVKLEV